jgi:hypothetical protein
MPEALKVGADKIIFRHPSGCIAPKQHFLTVDLTVKF